jgi:long-chain acyl-CoA synthetase
VPTSPIAERAATDPNGWALRDPARTYTWRELDDALARAVDAVTRLGLEPGERLAVMARNSAETVLAYLAALHAGIGVIPVSFHLTAREVAYLLSDGAAAGILTDAASESVAREACYATGARHVAAWGGPPPSTWDRMLAAASSQEPDWARVPRANLLYTSGTTGFPKGVERPTTLPPTVGDLLAELVPAAGTGPFLTVGPLYHTGPQRSVRRLAGGRPLVVLPSFDPETVLATVESERITGTLMVPAHFIRLLALPAEVRSRYDVSSLEVVDHTGAACPADVKRAMIEWWGPVLVEKYGGTESGTLCSITSQEWLEHPGSVGRALPPFEAVVVDEEGHELPTGVDGRLYFRDTTGAGIAFFGAPEKTADAHLAPNVFTVGDSGHVDADGYVFVTGRHSDMVVSGGVNLYPAEAENVIRTHPAVEDVAVIGVPHPTMGEELKALVVRRDQSLTEAEVIAFCRAGLAHPKCPRSVDFVTDLGRTPMGKLDKKTLARPYWTQVAP